MMDTTTLPPRQREALQAIANCRAASTLPAREADILAGINALRRPQKRLRSIQSVRRATALLRAGGYLAHEGDRPRGCPVLTEKGKEAIREIAQVD